MAIGCVYISGKEGGGKKKCFRPGSNRGPCACEAHVITATPRKRSCLQLAELVHSNSDVMFDIDITGTR